MKIRLGLGYELVMGKRMFGIGRDDDFFGWWAQNQYGTDYSSRTNLDAYKGTIKAAIERVSQTLAGHYEPEVHQKKGDHYDNIEHEFINLLYNPGGTDDQALPFTLSDLLEATISFYLLQGEVFWYMGKGKNSGKLREIVVLRGDKVGRVIDKVTGDITGFFVRESDGGKIPIALDEMLPIIGFNPKDAYKGMGKIQGAIDLIGIEDHSTQFTNNFFKNNAGISGILSVKGDVVKTAFKKLVRKFRDKYEGVDAAGKTMIIRDTEASFTKLGLGLDELQMPELRKMSKQDISMIFGVPLPLLGESDQNGLGRNNIEALEYLFLKYTIEPLARKLDGVFQFAIRRYFNNPYPQFKFSHENFIPADEAQELAERVAAVDKWVTRNEVRAKEGLDPIDGGDQLFVPINSIPVNEASLDAGSSSSTSGKGIKLIRRRVVEEPKKKDGEITSKERFRLTLMRNQVGYERQYKKAMRPLLKEQLKEALFNLEAHSSGFTKDFQLNLFDTDNANSSMVEKLTPVVRQLSEEQGALALVFAGDEDTEFTFTPQIAAALKNSTRKMAGNFNNDTIAKLNNTLTDGIAAGEGIGDLKNRVKEVFDNASNIRAERVARTETLKASNTATNHAYKQTGYVTEKEWYVNPDGCDICEAFDGKTVPLDEDFAKQGSSVSYTDENGDEQQYQVSYETVEVPPLHPNCRCTIMPVR